MATMIASDMEMKESWKAFSVSVRVSAREFLKVLSMARATAVARSGRVMPTMYHPTWSARQGGCLFQRLIEVVPVEEKLGFIDRFIPSPVDPPQDELPISREDRSLQGDGIPDPPSEPFCQLSARDKGFRSRRKVSCCSGGRTNSG